MVDDSHDTPPASRPDDGFTPELEAELCELVDSLLDDSIDPARLQRLETIVIEHRAAAVLYYELVHLWCILPFHLSRGMIDLTESVESNPTDSSMNESMVLPAILQGDVGDAEDVLQVLPPVSSPIARRPQRRFLKWFGGGAAAAIVLIGMGLGWRMTHRPRESDTAIAPLPQVVEPPVDVVAAPVPPAVLTATAGAQFEGNSTFKPRTPLSRGDIVRLTQGGIELTFASGAVAVVRGPASVRIVDDNRMALDAGAVTAHVPPAAHGFRVDSPGSSVVDLGTDFGVRSVTGSGRSEVDVFSGLVDAAPLDAAGLQIARPVRVSTGQAVQLKVADPKPVSVPFVPAEFDRDIRTIRLPIHFHGTGVGVAAGAADPEWQVLSVPNDASWQPKPAVVLSSPWPKYAPNTPEGNWVSLTDPQHNVVNGEYVLRTIIELSGVEPATVSVQGRLAVDNQVTDIRVNGISTGVSTRALKADDDFALYAITFPATTAWRSGMNRIDVVLLNDSFDGSDKPSFMGMQASWSATASPIVLR